jgi:hypothetical protein
MDDIEPTYTVFAGHKRIAEGDLRTILLKTKEWMDRGKDDPVLVFEDRTGKQIELDFQGTAQEVLQRAMPADAKRGPGRPKLGVVSREISLLPRHWEWLEQQPQGISAAIRRLVDEARKHEPGKQRARLARDATGRFMWSMAGDMPHFEEASRALYAKDKLRFEELVREWPKDVREQLHRMAEDTW